jgi:Family of unknown function (DUF6515)
MSASGRRLAAALLLPLCAGLALGATPVRARGAGRSREHLDERYHHDRSYPDRGVFVSRLPSEHIDAPYDGRRYSFADGVWYLPRGAGFVVVAPPSGLYVPILPPYYTTLWVGGVPYYYANGVYYVYRGPVRGYEIVLPPPGAAPDRSRAARSGGAPAAPPPVAGSQLFVYPRRGQSPTREASDKRLCEQWASAKTGFDPLLEHGGSPLAGSVGRRAGYDRAMEACLEGRGYKVR